MRYMYTMKSYSAMQNNDNMSFESKWYNWRTWF
jgi:hypothetical protein